MTVLVIELHKGNKFEYHGRLDLVFGSIFIMIQADYRDGEWICNRYDGFYYSDVKSIYGEQREVKSTKAETKIIEL